MRRRDQGTHEIASDLVRNELPGADKNSSDISPDLAVHFIVGALMATLTWWLDRGAKLPPEEINVMFRRLAAEGIVSAYV